MDKKLNKGMVKKPAEVFSQCPSCDSADVTKFEGQAFCGQCDWNSIAVYEDCIASVRDRSEHGGGIRIDVTEFCRTHENSEELERVVVA
ncbi:MAG: hypothetical protein CL678_01485 [Bdellovibrionaceae bacterium]|nr:hypothetical protein [Pseudobdellovibrionaceae bacterium]